MKKYKKVARKLLTGWDPVLMIFLTLMIVACICLELISPTPEKVDNAEPPKEATTAEHEVIEVAEPAPEHEVPEEQDIFGDSIEPMPDEYYEALELLAHLIYSEVGDDGEESMWYAGSVVINRIKSQQYPDDLYSVIYQKGQYEVTWNGGLYREEPSDIAYEVAAELLNSGSILPDEVLYQAEFRQGSGVYEKVGGTYYCYE